MCFPTKDTIDICPIESYMCYAVLSCFSHVWLFAIPQTVTRQAPLSMGLSRQEEWSGLPFPPPEDLPYPGIELVSLASPALAGGFFTSWASGESPALCGDFTILHLQRICLRMPGSLQPCQQNSLLNFGMCQCDEIDYSLVIFICIFLSWVKLNISLHG